MSAPPSDIQPEAEPLPAQMLHPLVQDHKFLAAAAAVFLAIIVYRLSGSTSSSSTRKRRGVPSVLLVGPSDAGKTALLAQLAQGVRAETHTSMKSSITNIALAESPNEPEGPSKQIRLIDLPGHPRLQDDVKAHLSEADGLVFVVDVQALLRNAGAIAEQVPPILTTIASRPFSQTSPARLLILASKTDLLIRPTPTDSCPDIPAATRQTAIDRLQSILTREMDRLKQTRASTGGRIEGISSVASASKGWGRFFGLGSSGNAAEGEGQGEDEGLVWGGKGGFRWEDVEGVEISWGVAALGPVNKAAKGDEEVGEGLKEVREWMWDL